LLTCSCDADHLAAHFGLTPNQCLRCGKYIAVASTRRHIQNCTGGASSQRDHFGSALDYAHEVTFGQDRFQVAELLSPGRESANGEDMDSKRSDDEDELESYWEEERGNAQVSEDIVLAGISGMYGKQDVASRYSDLFRIDHL
jgi:hypothetical protein